jgi:predicted protein tyrosine phosphatase
MSFNKLYNTKNPNQGPEKRVLCLCSAGLLRSPTVAWVLGNAPYDYNTRAAGTSHEFALVGVDEYLICWADEIVCVSSQIHERLLAYCKEHEIDLSGTPVVVLDIPDIYQRRAPKLVALIEKQYQEYQHAEPEMIAREAQ